MQTCMYCTSAVCLHNYLIVVSIRPEEKTHDIRHFLLCLDIKTIVSLISVRVMDLYKIWLRSVCSCDNLNVKLFCRYNCAECKHPDLNFSQNSCDEWWVCPLCVCAHIISSGALRKHFSITYTVSNVRKLVQQWYSWSWRAPSAYFEFFPALSVRGYHHAMEELLINWTPTFTNQW